MKGIFILLALLISGSAFCELPPICQEIASLHNEGKLEAHYKQKFSWQETRKFSEKIHFERPSQYEEPGEPGYLLDINSDGIKEFVGSADYGTGHFGSLRIWNQSGKLLSSHEGQSDDEYTGLRIAIAEIRRRNYIIGFSQSNADIPFRLIIINKDHKAETPCFFKYTGEYHEDQKIRKDKKLCDLVKSRKLKSLPIQETEWTRKDESNSIFGTSDNYDVDNDGKNDHIDLIVNSVGCCVFDYISARTSPLVEKFFLSETAYKGEKANLIHYQGKIFLERKFSEENPTSLHKIGVISNGKLETICSFTVRAKIAAISPSKYRSNQ